MTQTRAVLLDLYDTLAWTRWPAFRAALEGRFGLSTAAVLDAFTATRPARSVGTFGSAEGNMAAILDAAGVAHDPQLVRRLVEEWMSVLLGPGVRLWEDSLPVIRELRRRGIRTAVVSNCDHATRPVVDRLGLEEEADAVILSFELGIAKPDAGIYLAALDAVGGVEPATALFVDDQARYCDGAAAVGVRTLLIHRNDPSPEAETSEPGGHRVIRDLRALLDLV